MADENNSTPAVDAAPGIDIGDEIMNEVAAHFGQKPAATTKPAAAAAAEGEEHADETDEEKQAREQAEAADNTDGGEETEEEKVAREAAEAEADEPVEETEAEKQAREQAEADDAAANPGKADKTAAAAELEKALKDQPAEVRAAAQKVIDSVIDQHVVTARAESTRLGERVTQLTTELETEQKKHGPTIVPGINPVFMAEDATVIDTREDEIEQFERWAAKSLRAGGVNLPDSEGYDDKKPSYTVEQIEARLEDILQEKKKTLPMARQNLQARVNIEKKLREVYPAIYDPKSAEYAQVQQVFKVLPELKRFADARVIALKQILGDRALAELISKSKKESLPAGKGQEPKTPPPKKTPPRAPGGGSTAKGSVLDRKSTQTAVPEAMKKAMQNPGNKAAFKGAVAALTADLL